jgi:hypothetical protein
MDERDSQELSAQSSQSEGWQLWRFNPRFYRPSRRPQVFQEVYWVFGFEFLAMFLLGIAVYFGSIKPGLEQRRKEMDIYQRLKEIRMQPSPSNSAPEPIKK